MIKLMTQMGATPMEVRLSGKITDDDYEDVLTPALDAAIEANDRVRILAIIADDFEGYEFDAMLEDARLGLRHWNGFDRVAMVCGLRSINMLVRGFSALYPCPVAIFAPGEEDDARRWLRESLGALHQEDLGDGVLKVSLLGKLDAAAYDGEAEDMNAFIRRNDRFRLLLDLRDFDGWQGLAALDAHLGMIRDHRQLIDRAAIVADAAWMRLAARVGRRLLGIDAQVYPSDAFETAKADLLA
ncbi:STAS/SEC14 domain-containing protein [Salipiger sp. 1_MG-2023]|uniref:STAS/SEC14 domain-containing protein n=1 Tax=Salipiger sp. 1_MG-2023 TaxID=3062665 RepID=UPI0026E24692|nr:STAS/SEC14 domain-containing protein [Salipiger sp. 1_MG-2023]MDO6586455.1 STAS/SEC14 domain-containing protein [Salipiger sp. 1_MG-2023]